MLGGAELGHGVGTPRVEVAVVDREYAVRPLEPERVLTADFVLPGRRPLPAGIDACKAPDDGPVCDSGVAHHRWALDHKLEQGRRLARIHLLSLAPVLLDHDVLEEHLVRRVAEVDDYVVALTGSDLEVADYACAWKEPAVGTEDQERVAIAQPELIHACVGRVEEAKAVLAPLDLEEGLGDAVEQEDISQAAVVIEKVVMDAAVSVETLVLDGNADVEWIAVGIHAEAIG